MYILPYYDSVIVFFKKPWCFWPLDVSQNMSVMQPLQRFNKCTYFKYYKSFY